MSEPELTAEQFFEQVKNHKMIVEMDNGVNRCLLFRNPESPYNRYFRIVTYHGSLCISGDMGCAVFQRLDDMFEFFRMEEEHTELCINPDYWGEKLQTESKFGKSIIFDEERYEEIIREEFKRHCDCWSNLDWESINDPEDENHAQPFPKTWKAVEEELLCSIDNQYDAREAVDSFSFKEQDFTFQITDFWDYHLMKYSVHHLWRCYAIVWAITQYDKWKVEQGKNKPSCDRCDGTGKVPLYGDEELHLCPKCGGFGFDA